MMEELPWARIKTRGITLIQFKRYLSETAGEKAALEAISTLPEEQAQSIMNARKGAWYPFETQRLLREVIIAAINPRDPSDVIYDMGLVTASWDFSGFLSSLFSFISKETVLNHAATLWRKYYDRGKMSVVKFEENRSLIELTDFPCDEHFPPVVSSWMKVAIETLKFRNPVVNTQADDTHKPPLFRFELFWE
ncbi:hypothetical protein GF359_03820 [candidate division WOR-3 bacterium]|uniref:Uncharacterized protein n=1 Tax=candidate division WOR-3 bacterium TaxID=2052148 RepID=A0A9D5K9W9_UNCW3|nr:hypothetical protein [candidate division WOR-3 bacterium]MBD3364324.1 hypothetical protein [candidate division WOR-3 bacterium]